MSVKTHTIFTCYLILFCIMAAIPAASLISLQYAQQLPGTTPIFAINTDFPTFAESDYYVAGYTESYELSQFGTTEYYRCELAEVFGPFPSGSHSIPEVTESIGSSHKKFSADRTSYSYTYSRMFGDGIYIITKTFSSTGHQSGPYSITNLPQTSTIFDNQRFVQNLHAVSHQDAQNIIKYNLRGNSDVQEFPNMQIYQLVQHLAAITPTTSPKIPRSFLAGLYAGPETNPTTNLTQYYICTDATIVGTFPAGSLPKIDQNRNPIKNFSTAGNNYLKIYTEEYTEGVYVIIRTFTAVQTFGFAPEDEADAVLQINTDYDPEFIDLTAVEAAALLENPDFIGLFQS